MSILRIHLFGNFRLSQGVTSAETRVIPNVQALLALLLLQPGQMFSRDKIISFLWNESSEEQAHSCLNTALWRLRKILEPKGVPAGTYLLSSSSGEVGFNSQSDYWVDVLQFETCIQRIVALAYAGVSDSNVRQLEQAVALYNQDLLEGFYYDWVIKERERLHLTYLDALYYLLSFYQHRQEYAKAIRWGQQIIIVDPLREDVHRHLMRLYTENGQRALAVRQYRYCEKILKIELGIEPMPETQYVYEKILGTQHQRLDLAEDQESMVEALKSVDSVLTYINRAQRALEDIITRLNK